MYPADLKFGSLSRVSAVAFVVSLLGAVTAAASGLSSLSDLLFTQYETTAVSAKVFHGYTHAQRPDGTYRPETYVFANGGNVGQQFRADPTIDDLSFDEITHPIAESLAAKNYQPCDMLTLPNEIIAVYWGTTAGTEDESSGRFRDWDDASNARLLGFDSESGLFVPDFLDNPAFYDPSYHAYLLRVSHPVLMENLEADRYFVVLQAYDYESAHRYASEHRGRPKLLWETRFSIMERRNDFGKELPKMAKFASNYFGQATYGLVMKPQREARVEYGEMQVIDNVSPTALGKITGRYDYKGLVLTVTSEGGQAYAQLGLQPRFPIYSKSDTEFYWMVSDATVSFKRNRSGAVVAADYEQSGRTVRAQRMPEVTEIHLDDAAQVSLVGDYVSTSNARMAIRQDQGRLYIQMRGQPRFELGATSDTEFFLKQWDVRMTVIRNPDGAVKGVIVHRDGRDDEWRRAP